MLLIFITNLLANRNRTIGSASDVGGTTGLNIDSVSGSGPWDLVMNQDVNFDVETGDFVLDSNSDTFVVTAVTDNSNFEVTDELGVGDAPDTGTPTVDRA